MLSIIIPTLNAARTLRATLAALAEAGQAYDDVEIVVSDGGSADNTPDIARAAGARIITGPPGRGVQLAAGAAASRGTWFLFLHADTTLAPGWAKIVRAFCDGPGRVGRAAYFRFALDDETRSARRIAMLVHLRCRLLALPYGDQGLLIARDLYESIGGFRPLPLMEDVEIVRRLGRHRLVPLDCTAVTSAERYRRDGWWRRPARNLVCLGLYLLGVAPDRLARLYR